MIQEADKEYFDKYKEYAVKPIRREETTPIPKLLLQFNETPFVNPEFEEFDDKPTNEIIKEKFMERVIKTNTCWIWDGAKKGDGYGTFNMFNYGSKNAHRVSYELFKGKIPKGYDVDHLCRERCCVNPEHLEAVTRQENIQRAAPYRDYDKTKCLPKYNYAKIDSDYQKLRK